MRLNGSTWDEEVLRDDLGAKSIADVRDEGGGLVGFDVHPDIDMSGYEAALAIRQKVRLRAYAASKRYDVETGGTTIGGMSVLTDRQSQNLITGAFALSNTDDTLVIRFKAADGSFHELDAAAIQALALKVAAHVQTCFAMEADVLAGIEGGAITTNAEIDAIFAVVPGN